MTRVDEADELYGLPLDEFVAARTALAKRLRKEGRTDEAAAVGGLRKPSLALWGVNQAVRHDAGELRALLRAADRLRSGEADATGADFSRAVEALVRTASRLLEEAGHAASDATTQRVETTLRAAAASSGEEREALARGALDRELEPAGFEAMASLAASGGSAPRAPARRAGRGDAKRREETKRRERVEAAERALAEARTRERALRGDAERAEREAERARNAADRAAADAGKAERALERARARLSD